MLAEMTRDAAPSAQSAHDAQRALREATIAHESGRLDEAEALYLDALRANPYAAEAEHGLAWLLAQRGDWKGALPRFGRALKLRPWEKEFWISQLEALMQLGQHEAVHRLLHRAMQSGLPAEVAAGFEKRLRERRTALLAAQVRASGKTAKQAADAPRKAVLALRETFLKRDFAAARASATALVAAYVLITTPLNCRIHGPVPDCWRFTEFGLKVLLRDFEIVLFRKLDTPDRNLFPLEYGVIVRRASESLVESDPREMTFQKVD